MLVKTDGVSANAIATNFIACLADGDGHNGTITGATNTSLAHFTQSLAGHGGNKLITYGGSLVGGLGGSAAVKINDIGRDTYFRSGSTIGGSIPILRGVLLAPSGVILHLSGTGATKCISSSNPTLATPGPASWLEDDMSVHGRPA